jgi:hypothetical protein
VAVALHAVDECALPLDAAIPVGDVRFQVSQRLEVGAELVLFLDQELSAGTPAASGRLLSRAEPGSA